MEILKMEEVTASIFSKFMEVNHVSLIHQNLIKPIKDIAKDKEIDILIAY